MSKLLFNINDLAHVLVISACILHAFTLNFQGKRHKYHIFLTLFLVTIAIRTLDTLFYWSVEIKDEVSAFSPHIYFIFKFTLFLQAPLLYIFVKSVIYSDFAIKKLNLLHFLPAVLYLCFIPVIYYSLGEENLNRGIQDYLVLYDNPAFQFSMWASKVSFLVYGGLAYWILKHHESQLEDVMSNTEGLGANWLKVMVIGFLTLWFWTVFAQVATQFNLIALSDVMGVLENYIRFLLINVLVLMSLSRVQKIQKQPSQTSEPSASNTYSYTDEQVKRLEDAMAKNQAYLDPDLSLEQLSELTSLPQRLLSSIVNRHFNKNFFEFVNSYRVDHAKRLISDNSLKMSMLDVMAESGFNSKSAFNRFFKKFTDMTPTQYKNQLNQKTEA